MITIEMQEDRRVFPRLSFKDRALVMAAEFIGLVRDISLGGLAFYYCHKGAMPTGDTTMSIIIANDQFVVKEEDFQVVSTSDASCTGINREPDWSIRVCRVRFRTLDDENFMALWRFIKRNCLLEPLPKGSTAQSGLIPSFSPLPATRFMPCESQHSDRL